MPEDPLLVLCEGLNQLMPHNVLATIFAEIPSPQVLFAGGGGRNIKVHINDAGTGNGIQNVEVQLKSGSTRTRITDSAGHADFQNTGAGNYSILATPSSLSKAGYTAENNVGSIKVTDGSSAMSHTMSFKKAPAMYITVLDDKTMKPVSGARVELNTATDPNYIGFVYGITDSNGKVTISGLFANSTYPILITHPQYFTYNNTTGTKPRSVVLGLTHR